MKRFTVLFALSTLLVIGLAGLAAAQITDESPGYVMRYADIGGGHIVFHYEGDLWLVPESGGAARRITSHPGTELAAKISPDGSLLAFTGEYDGGNDVYVMDILGGVPERKTFHPSADLMLDWCPDGHGLIFRSNREYPTYVNEIYRMALEGGMPMRLPVDYAGLASVAPDRSAVAYNRLSRENRTWKRYEGGLAQDIWVATFADGKIEKITDWQGTDNFPMWMGDVIYFTSDRTDATLNIWGFDTRTGQTKQYTFFDDYDVKYPSSGDGKIVFQHGAGLKVFDTTSGAVRDVPITIPSDRRHLRVEMVSPAPAAGSFGLSPAGERVLLEARGAILNLAADEGDPVNLTNRNQSREKNATWSPDGRWITFVSDRSGEEELYLIDQLGQQDWQQITDNGFGFLRQAVWSPDSKYLVFSDKFMRLHLVDVAKKKTTEIAHSDYDDAWERWGIMDYVWSPDSRWVAFTKQTGNMHEEIWLYDLDKGELAQATDNFYNSWSPSFSPDGKYLYFLSNRTFDPIMGRNDQNHVFMKMALPYMVILQDGQRSPFYEDNVLVAVEGDDEDDDKGDGDTKTVIDLDGLGDRILACPDVDPHNYFRLEATNDGFLMLRKNDPEFIKYQHVDDHTGGALDLVGYTLDDQSLDTLIEGIANYHLSADGKKLIFRHGSSYGVVDAGKNAKTSDGAVDLSVINLRVDRLEEYPQIFTEAWRIQRDWFYDENLHGVDWQAMYDKYAPFVAGCGSRGDLNYLIGEMISELNIGHTYIYGGDYEDGGATVRTGLLGAEFKAVEKADYYQVGKIVPGVSWDPGLRSPLAEPGVGVDVGDYLIAIDGIEVKVGDNVYRHLIDKAGRMVTLTVNDKPEAKKARTVRVRTLRSERGLRYRAWVDANLAYVTEKSGGRIGYLHMPNMSYGGLVEFGRSYYAQTGKDAIILDDRFNGGGFVSGMVIDRLERRLWSLSIPREGKSDRNPERVHHGPLAVLINESTYSDGEMFAEAVKRKDLAVLIGMRTWGGSTGIEPHQDLVDGGGTTPPQFGLYGLDGSWPIEGWGVVPHIEVQNMPADVVAGNDAQLDKAIELLLKDLETSNGKWDIPDTPPYPQKFKPRMSNSY